MSAIVVCDSCGSFLVLGRHRSVLSCDCGELEIDTVGNVRKRSEEL
jgi:predicted RNA-binding Zn-ribbon protein involved in translation (DUF1610 family)